MSNMVYNVNLHERENYMSIQRNIADMDDKIDDLERLYRSLDGILDKSLLDTMEGVVYEWQIYMKPETEDLVLEIEELKG